MLGPGKGIEWVLSRPEVRSIEGRNTFLGQILASVSTRSQGLSFSRLLTPIEMFILSRSLLNTLRNAIWSDETKQNPIPKEYLPK